VAVSLAGPTILCGPVVDLQAVAGVERNLPLHQMLLFGRVDVVACLAGITLDPVPYHMDVMKIHGASPEIGLGTGEPRLNETVRMTAEAQLKLRYIKWTGDGRPETVHGIRFLPGMEGVAVRAITFRHRIMLDPAVLQFPLDP
jgi:hypothetical protein